MFLSILTPTYNRAYTLKRCYDSLCAQTDKDFEWIVVDDGSSDTTKELVSGFILEDKINIRYFYKENGGKPSAHNMGVRNAKGEMCVCVDSDDALTPLAVETAKTVWKSRKDTRTIGILAKRGDFKEHNPICTDWPDFLTTSAMIELQEKYNFSGDTALFFDTAVMQKHYFKEFPGEKFVPEDALYAELDEVGPMILLKDVLYLCEYLEGGLTSNYKKLLMNNPMGTAYCYYRRMLSAKGFAKKLKNAIISESYLSLSGRKAEYAKSSGKLILTIAKLAVPIYRKRKIGG